MFARIAKNAGAQGLALLVSFADRFIVVGILLRAWGPQVYAEWTQLLSLAGLLSLGELGLNIYYGNILQKAWATADVVRFQRTIATALTCSAGVALLVAGLALSIMVLSDLARVLSITALQKSTAIIVLLLIGSVSLSRITRGAFSQIFRGRREFALGTLVDLVSIVTVLLFTVAAALLGAGPLVVAVVCGLSDLVAGWGFMLWALARRYPDLRFRPALPTKSELSDIAGHVRWLAVLQGVPVAWLNLPVVYLGAIGIAGASLVSFVVLRTLVNFVRSLGTMLSIGSGVEIIATHHAERKHEAISMIKSVGLGLSVLTAAMATGIFIFGAPLVGLWTARPAIYDSNLVLCLLASAVFTAPTSAVGSHLMLSNAPRPIATALLCQLAVGIAACAVLARTYGVVGAAAGLALGEVFGQAVLLPILAGRYILDLGYRRYLLRCARAVVLTVTWCGLVGYAVVMQIGDETILHLTLAGLIWGLLGMAPALCFALPAPQRQALRHRMVGGLPPRTAMGARAPVMTRLCAPTKS